MFVAIKVKPGWREGAGLISHVYMHADTPLRSHVRISRPRTALMSGSSVVPYFFVSQSAVRSCPFASLDPPPTALSIPAPPSFSLPLPRFSSTPCAASAVAPHQRLFSHFQRINPRIKITGLSRRILRTRMTSHYQHASDNISISD